MAARKNIFDILNENIGVLAEIRVIEELMGEYSIDNETPEDIVDQYCFREWKARGRCIGTQDMRERLNLNEYQVHHIQNLTDALLYLEYVSNIIWLCNEKFDIDDCDIANEYEYLQENVQGLIADLGYEAKVFEDEEKVLLLEKDAAATAVAEISDAAVSEAVLEYNHFLLKGNLEEKRKILLQLADVYEPRKSQLKGVDSSLESNLGFMLNKMNIRHNNKEGKHVSAYLAQMPDEELEGWYDETYQMLLLAFLELDNVERNTRVNELKRGYEGK